MKKIYQLFNYIKYIIISKNTHGVHSPFVFDLLNNVFYNFSEFYCYSKIEELRSSLKKNKTTLFHTDYGANPKNITTTISNIARKSAKQPKYAQLLFRIVNHFQPQNVLELGTSIGISTAYIASGNVSSSFITLEGSAEIAKIAKENFEKLGYKNIQLIEGNFNTTLTSVLKRIETLDFVFFDGNHTYEATMNYFYQCLAKKHNSSIFIFDDIYWSPEMTKAWEEIKNNNEVTVTIDIFQMGIIFFRKEQMKQHFIIRY